MTTTDITGKLLALAYTSANSRRYLSAVFAAYQAGDVVVALPGGAKMRSVPGVTVTVSQTF
jgi:hypothetical protein